MSTEQNNPQAELDTRAATLAATVSRLQSQVQKKASSAKRKQQTVFVLGAILAIAVVISMTALTRMTRQLDAGALAQIGRIEVQKRLPEGRAQVQSYLRAEAPHLVGQALRGLVDMIPRLRALVLRDLNSKVDAINEEFERKVIAQMTESIHKSKADIDKAWPKATDEEKLTKLVGAVAADFNTNIEAATNELYPAYQAEMSRVTAYIDRLCSTDASQLTEAEREQKEMIETLLRLIFRERRGQ